MVSQLPIIVVPGIQGHWQWMRPALASLRLDGRDADHGGQVLTFSLNEEDGSGDPFAQWSARIDQLIETSGHDRAVIIGVSFGGLVAARYAAQRPERVAGLVLVSAPSPRVPLNPGDEAFLQHPIAMLPLFALRGVRRLAPEIIAAKPGWLARLSFAASYGVQVLAKPMAPRQSVRWVRAWQAADIAADCRRISAPTHVITGEPHLDKVVPVDSTLDYLALIPGATAAVLPRTGHIGLVSRPEQFASLIREFLDAVDDPRSRRSA